MKTQIKHIFLIILFALIGFTACQDEVIEINNPNTQQAIVANSSLANLISNTTSFFVSANNILEDSNCFSVELPVTVIVSDITIVIETEADLELLADLVSNLDTNEAAIDFIFPITLIFTDYSEFVIDNEEQLQNLISECELDEDDSIECIDFVYPISFSVFNSEFTITDVITIDNDEAFYNFLEDLEDDDNALIASLNYPVSLVYANGESIAVNTNQELADAIASAEADCDDDDDANCDADAIELALKECQWEIVSYSSFTEFEGFILEFNTDYTFAIILEDNQTLTEGNTWSVVSNDAGSFLVLATEFEDLGGDWQVTACDDDRFEFAKNNETMVIEQVCEDDLDCSITDISTILQACPWDFSDGTDTFNNYQLVFNAAGDLQITEGFATSAIGGAWSLQATDNGIVITLSQLTAFQDNLGGDWLIVECDEDNLVIVRGDTTLELEQDCFDENDVFNCFDNFEIEACANDTGEAVFNLTADTIGLIDCAESFVASFHYSLADAETNTGAISNTEFFGNISTQIYLRIEAENGAFQVFTVNLNAVECNLFDCFESFDAVIELCDVDNDTTEAFDLTTAFANCTPQANLVTYHLTEIDALNNVNAIPNPEQFNNITNPQTVFVRVEIGALFQIFTIQLTVQDCSEDLCTEQDVIASITECIWNAVSYNGSDNLMIYNFDFESSSNIVIIYTDQITIDATWMLSQSSEGTVISFANIAGPNIQAITGDWLVVECSDGRFELHRGDDILVLERTCS